jgi:TBC1 domain family member 4
VSHKRVPFSFIDDALPKFKAYDAQRSKLQGENSNIASSAESIHLNANSTESLNVINQKSDSSSSDVKYEGDKENSARTDAKDHVLQRGQSVMVLGNKKE